MTDLFNSDAGYSARDIEVLEGLEPVRRRPGMYIGGTGKAALHHLATEILDNAMDEAVAGHASRIELALEADGSLTVRDNGRGIPVDNHPRFPGKSALEVILTTLHSGGKFSGQSYATAGGLHGVGLSVVNALSEWLEVEVARDRLLYRQRFSRGVPQGPLEQAGAVSNRRGTTVRFFPDAEIFGGDARFDAQTLFRMSRAKAYLFRGVEIRWQAAPEMLAGLADVPETALLHFPGGLADYLADRLQGRPLLVTRIFTGEMKTPEDGGRVEWAIAWPDRGEGFSASYCNTVPTPQGGSHETALRTAIGKGLRAYGELTGNRKAAGLTGEDAMGEACAILSVFIREPQFQGQTKEKLTSAEAGRLVETAVRDRFDHWLAEDPANAGILLDRTVERMEDRLDRRRQREMPRKAPARRLRLPGKLTDCTLNSAEGTEIFLVEGDSAGGSAKQARDRATQAVLPLRGKILNVASASDGKLRDNQALKDLALALGCETGGRFNLDSLRYGRVIIMTDADVDGAHISALLMTFFFQEMRPLIQAGRLFLALPPLYRISRGGQTRYARDDAHMAQLMATVFTGKGKPEISRFKGLGEMPPAQLKETTMDPARRSLLRVTLPEEGIEAGEDNTGYTARIVETLMGRKAEGRFQYIQENAKFVEAVDI